MRIRAEDFSMSPLAAYGLVAISAILGFVALEKYAALENALEQKVIAAQAEFATLSTIKDTNYWNERLTQSAAAREHVQSRIWRGSTSGVIAAELQQSLRTLATKYQFSQIQLRVDPDIVDVDGMPVLSFEFSAMAETSKSLADFFEGLALASKIIIIEDANFAQSVRDRRPPRLSITGIIPIETTSVGGT